MSDFNRYVTANPGTPKIRTRFDISHRHLTTLNAGSLYPIACWEVLPSDTFTIDMSAVVRMQTPIHPVMDNCYMDVFFFFVPNRLVWEHWKEFMGEATDGFLPSTEYEVPDIWFNEGPVVKGSIYEKLGIPQGFVSDDTVGYPNGVNELPFRGYGLIWNDWFRDQNVSSEVYIDRGDNGALGFVCQGDNLSWFEPTSGDMVTDWYKGRPLPVAKYHDLFTSALPLPQRGPAVALPLTTTNDLLGLPVYPKSGNIAEVIGKKPTAAMKFGSKDSDAPPAGNIELLANGYTYSSTTGTNYPSGNENPIYPSNLFADTSYLSLTIEEFRQSYAIQRLYEREARSGSRYTELIRSAYGVVSPDARQQRPELLGLRRIPITMTQVVQNSSTDETSPQGNTAAYSLTSDKSSYCTYSSTEHGYIMAVCAIRTDHTYQQGLDREFSRRRRFDFYDPVFANLGEQAILNREIFAFGPTAQQNEVFGYQEAWYEYRNKRSYVSGEMSSLYAQSLDVWHYGDHFETLPTLSPEFIYETRENIDRTLAVDSNVADQFLADFYFETKATRPLPFYSVPGLSGQL